MIIDFLTSSLRRRVLNGQPLIFKKFEEDYRNAAAFFERLPPEEQERLSKPKQILIPFLRERSDRESVLFLKPKSSLHVGAAVESRNAVVLRDGLVSEIAQDGSLQFPVIYWNYLIGKAFLASAQDSSTWVQVAIQEALDFLEAVLPKLIILSTDVPFVERLFAIVAKAMGIPVVTIQHGLFSGKFDPSITEGDSCDYFIVWSEFMKRLLLRSGYLEESKILVSGYPYPVNSVPRIEANSRAGKTVVFLGQPFENFQSALDVKKLSAAKWVSQSCSDLGLQFRYRPHPSESVEALLAHLPARSILPRDEPLPEVFRKHGAFVSLTSSALVEAALHERVAIQIYDEEFQFEDLGAVGACFRCSLDLAGITASLQRYKRGDLAPQGVSRDYLQVSEDPGKTFASLFDSVVQDHALGRSRIKKPGPLFCLVGPTRGDHHPVAPSGFSWLTFPTETQGKPFEGAVLLENPGGLPIIPSTLDLNEATTVRCVLEEARSVEMKAISGEIATYGLTHFRTLSDLEVQILIKAPGEDPNECVAWMQGLWAAFRNAPEGSVKLGSPPANPGKGVLSPDPIVSYTHLVYLQLVQWQTESSRTPMELSDDCQSLLDRSFVWAFRMLWERAVSPDLGARSPVIVEGMRFALQAEREEMERLRSSKLWKIREAYGRLRGKPAKGRSAKR